MLLHGIAGTGEAFGAGYDPLAERGRLIVPDVLGFAGSMNEERSDFSVERHLEALDGMAGALQLDGAALTVAGHSMGALLAVRWAARRPETQRVVTFCAPLYRDAAEADRHIGAMGWQERFFALETPFAHRTCAWMCRHRRLAEWVSVAISPQWPVPLSRRGVQHTWHAYLGGMNGLIRSPAWVDALQRLADRAVSVVLADGALDSVPVPGRAAEVAGRFPSVSTSSHPAASHDLPISHPDWCRALLTQAGP